MDLSHVPVGDNPIDKRSGAMFVDRFLHTAMFYPANYGFIPHTLSEDGDPVDCMVVSPTPVAPGVIVRARPIGALEGGTATIDPRPRPLVKHS